MAVVLMSAASGFAPMTPANAPVVFGARTTTPACMLEETATRRAALVGAGMTALAALPSFANADDNEDAIAAIAAKTMAKNEAAKEAQLKKVQKTQKKAADGVFEKENAGADLLVKGAIGGSFFFSLPFFYKNLARLGLKFSSVVNKDIDESQYKR